eukprot:1841590-Prymnesium_polylepis.1
MRSTLEGALAVLAGGETRTHTSQPSGSCSCSINYGTFDLKKAQRAYRARPGCSHLEYLECGM